MSAPGAAAGLTWAAPMAASRTLLVSRSLAAAKTRTFASWSAQREAGSQDSTSWDPALPWMLPDRHHTACPPPLGHIRVSGPLYVSA
jgi:hypothetical protein